MVHSPYRKTVYPPIQDLGEYRRELCQQRSRWEEGERDKYAEEALLGLGEALVDHCNFLDTKLDIKVCIHSIDGIPAKTVDKIANEAKLLFM